MMRLWECREIRRLEVEKVAEVECDKVLCFWLFWFREMGKIWIEKHMK